VDTPPDRRSPLVLGALRVATVVVVPVIAEYQSLAGLERLLETVSEVNATAHVRALLSRWESRTRLAQDVHRDLVTSHPGMAISTAVPRDQRAAEASAAGLPVVWYAPRSPAAVAYATATYEIAATGGLRVPKEPN
jgi:chromosome partitioning protein